MRGEQHKGDQPSVWNQGREVEINIEERRSREDIWGDQWEDSRGPRGLKVSYSCIQWREGLQHSKVGWRKRAELEQDPWEADQEEDGGRAREWFGDRMIEKKGRQETC